MFDEFKKKLMLKVGDQPSLEHEAMLSHVKTLLNISRKKMSEYYDTWDHHDDIFRSKRAVDREDLTARTKGQPDKMIVPLTYAQIMTFVSFCVQSVMQNKRFFELEHQGNKNPLLKEPMELVLERDVRQNQWQTFLVQFFLDVAKFWLGAAEVCYKEETRSIRIKTEETVEGAFGVSTKTENIAYQQIPTFTGNKVYPISPFRFFPDTRQPLTRFQEGEFCGSEDMFSMSSLRGDDEYLFNLDMIPKMNEQQYNDRKRLSRIAEMEVLPMPRSSETLNTNTIDGKNMVTSGSVVVSKIVMDIRPSDFKVNDETPLGKENFPVRYMCWIANDKTIIRFEEAYYLHGQFPYIMAQFLPDQHQTVNEGLSSVCDQITALITWKLNMHLTSQKNSTQSKYIIDPAGVDTKSLESRNPYILLKKNASQTGVERYIKQFKTEDVTQGVMQDVAALKDLLESISGMSAQMQGQYSSGRRSATQDRVVAQGASARGKTTLGAIWDAAFEPLGRQFIANDRQEMDLDTFRGIVGGGPFGPLQDTNVQQLFAVFKADPLTIAKSQDFFVFDGTLPSEKAFLAQSLQEIFVQITQNPLILQMLGYGPAELRFIFDEIYELRGLTPPMLPPPAPAAGPAAAPVVLPAPQPGQLNPGLPFGRLGVTPTATTP